MFFWEPGDDNNEPSCRSDIRSLMTTSLVYLECFAFILQSLSLCILTKISWSTINFKTENGSRLITEYYAFTIRVGQVNILCEKFGVSACSQISTV